MTNHLPYCFFLITEQDCNMPPHLQDPGASVENVDVMDFLGLKRAEGLKAPQLSDSP